MNFQGDSFGKIGDALKEEIQAIGKIVEFKKREMFFNYDDTLELFLYYFEGQS